MASLRALAQRLEAAHIEEPANALVARELRATLLVLGGGRGGEPVLDAVDRLRAEWESGA